MSFLCYMNTSVPFISYTGVRAPLQGIRQSGKPYFQWQNEESLQRDTNTDPRSPKDQACSAALATVSLFVPGSTCLYQGINWLKADQWHSCSAGRSSTLQCELHPHPLTCTHLLMPCLELFRSPTSEISFLLVYNFPSADSHWRFLCLFTCQHCPSFFPPFRSSPQISDLLMRLSQEIPFVFPYNNLNGIWTGKRDKHLNSATILNGKH